MNITELCVNCKQNNRCTMCWKTSNKKCPHFIQKTNADRIRSMSDDDLNDLFHEIYDAGVDDAVSYEWGHRTNSFEWTMEWLQQPTEGE